MIHHHDWLRTRRKLLEQVKGQVEVRLGPLTPVLRRYARSVEKDFRGRWQICRDSVFHKALSEADFVLGADFHAYSQTQRAYVRLWRDLSPRIPIVLALECLNFEHERAARDYVEGKISEARFLQVVAWDKTWGFPWENYRPLFELARNQGIPIRGLNKRGIVDLKRRDEWCAARLVAIKREHPEATVFAVVGEWHLAKDHLPKALRKRVHKAGRAAISATSRARGKGPLDSKVVVIFQDVEPLYFNLARKRLETVVDLLHDGNGRYCMMVSPPWMKWQSYLMYLEEAYDRDLQEDIAVDYTDHIVSLVELLERDLKIQTKKSRIQVFCPNSSTALARLRVSLPRRFARALVYHLEHDLSFYLPEKDWLYLSRPTINHATALAGQFIHAHLCRRQKTLWHMPDDFLALIWVEAVGFFFSKWLNPKRKAETLSFIRLRLEASRPKDRGRQALLLTLDHRLSEVLWVQTGRLRRRRFKAGQTDAYLEASRMIGSMLGERLFQKVRSQTISLPQLMSYLRIRVESRDFALFYWRLIKDLE